MRIPGGLSLINLATVLGMIRLYISKTFENEIRNKKGAKKKKNPSQ
jgi:hypothetical protein